MTANPFSNIPPIGPTSGAAPQAAANRFKPVDPLRLLRQHMLLLIVAGVIGLMLGGGTWYALQRWSPQYTSKGALVAKGPQGSAFDPSQGPQAGGNDITRYMENEAQRILSHEILRSAVDRQEVRQTQWFASFRDANGQPNFRRAVESLQEGQLSVRPQTDSTLILLSVSTTHKEDAPVILEAVIQTYLQQLRIETEGQNSELRAVFSRERDRGNEEIRQLQARIQQFISEEDIASMNVSQTDAGMQYAHLNQQQIQLETQMEAAKANYQDLIEQDKRGVVQASPSEQTQLELIPRIQRLDERVMSLKQSQRTLAKQYGEQHRAVQNVQDQIDSAQAQRKVEMDKELRELQQYKLQQAAKAVETIKAQIAAIQPKIQSASARMTDLQNKINTYNNLKTQLATAEDRRDRAANSLDELRVNSTRPDAVRIQRQVSPTQANLTFPKLTVVVPGITILVLGAVTGLLFLRELLDQRVKSPQDVKLLPEANLLGVIPDVSEDPSGLKQVEGVVRGAPTGLIAEQFRQVRTALLSKMDRRGYKTLLVVAAQPGAGASALTHNVAESLALAGRRVLVIDANFRRPNQHTLMDQPNDKGLVEVLRYGTDAEDLMHHDPDLSLSLLTAGDTHNAPPELLDGERFRALLGQLEARFDTILIDAPPALLASDAQLLAKHVDAMAIVVRAGRDKRGMIERMLNQLDGHRADILGVILNGVQSAAGGYFRKSYQQFYRYQANGHAVPAPEDAPEDAPAVPRTKATEDQPTPAARDQG